MTNDSPRSTEPSVTGQPDDRQSLRRRFPIGLIAIEVFSIVLGVFLALAVNQWREDRSDQKQAAAALANIEAEIRLNLQLLEHIHDANVAVAEAVNASDADSDTTDMSFTPGVQLRNTAWQTAQSVGVFAKTDYDVIVDLADLYAMQDVYRTLAYQLTQSMMNGAAVATSSGGKWDEAAIGANFGSYFNLLVEAESALMDRYRDRLGQSP